MSGKEEQPVEHVETSKPKLVEEKEVHRPDYLIIDEKLANIDFKVAKCCKPIHGDDIFGFVTIKDGIKSTEPIAPTHACCTKSTDIGL